MNNYLLQRLICRAPIKLRPFKNPWQHKNYTVTSTHLQQNPSTQPSKESDKLKNKEKEWITVYRFPYIFAASRVAKLRKFQYLVTCVAPPVSYGLEVYQIVPEASSLLTLSLCVSMSITLTICSVMFRRLIGFIYIDSEKENMKIGYLTFNGKREDKEIKIENVKTFAESQKFKYQMFRTVATYDDKIKYKLIDLGGIEKRDDFELLFGSG